jgi:hypothetical protein
VLNSLLERLEQDRSLDDPARLRERLDALDRLELCVIDGEDQGRAEALRAKLEAVNEALYRQLRDAIRQGAGAEALSRWMEPQPGDAVGEAQHADGYDYLDELVSGVLQFGQPDDADIEQPSEMVFYQPTPARHVFDLIRRVELTACDVLVDLGSGLGHVPLLAAIGSPAQCIGVERESAYVDCFRRSAEALNIARATCVRQDAREADLSSGTVFYLYTPFTGTVMRTVLDRLRREAAGRRIRIATYGPCTTVISAEPWLEVVGAMDVRRVALFRSRA